MELNERVKVLKAKDLVVLSYDEAVQWCLVWIEDWEVSRLNKDAPSGWEWIVGLKHCWLASSCDASERTITEITFNNAIGHEEIRKDQSRTAVRAEEKAALLDFGEPAEEISSALDVQIDGEHYKKLAIQPIEYCFKNNLNCIQSKIVKYATRYKDKGGKVDLEKIKHLVDLLIEFEYSGED